MSEKQILARERNWNKARLLGITLNDKILTNKEKKLFAEIIYSRRALLENWDENTVKLTGGTLKPYKCKFCGKRSMNPYQVEAEGLKNENLCKKCFNLYK